MHRRTSHHCRVLAKTFVNMCNMSRLRDVKCCLCIERIALFDLFQHVSTLAIYCGDVLELCALSHISSCVEVNMWQAESREEQISCL